MLSKEQVAHYGDQGYLKVAQLFTPGETAELASEMVRVYVVDEQGNIICTLHR